VIEAMWRALSAVMLPASSGTYYRILGDSAFINFAAESGINRTDRFRIVEAWPSPVDGNGFGRLDAAVLKIEPTAMSQTVPAAVPLAADSAGPDGSLSSFCVIGFPGPPPYVGGMREGVNWAWVHTTLFGGRYGVKRLGPGEVHKTIGTLQDDPQLWVFGHDATTLGGSSGSATLAWLDAGTPAFGLHFAGASVDSNYAHGLYACREPLRALGAPVSG